VWCHIIQFFGTGPRKYSEAGRKCVAIGQLADKNAKENKTKISEAEAEKSESQPQKQDKSYIRKINSMTPKQRHKWIMEGD
jgi:ribosome recycling factor